MEVLKKYRRKGLGKEFVKMEKEELCQDNLSELWLGTATDFGSEQALLVKQMVKDQWKHVFEGGE